MWRFLFTKLHSQIFETDRKYTALTALLILIYLVLARATIMNYFRIPLNFIVIVVLLQVGKTIHHII